MCGRISQVLSFDELDSNLKVDAPVQQALNYNVAPTQKAWVILDTNRSLSNLDWGLIPYWTKDGQKSGAPLINARTETVFEKASFRKPILSQRCLVVVDSFYEWRRAGKSKIPYRIQAKNKEPLYLAGIWDQWTSAQHNQSVRSFSILTTAPNQEMKSVHDRMPLIMATTQHRQAWLSDLSKSELEPLLQKPADDLLSYYELQAYVNKVKNTGPKLHLAASKTLFDL